MDEETDEHNSGEHHQPQSQGSSSGGNATPIGPGVSGQTDRGTIEPASGEPRQSSVTESLGTPSTANATPTSHSGTRTESQNSPSGPNNTRTPVMAWGLRGRGGASGLGEPRQSGMTGSQDASSAPVPKRANTAPVGPNAWGQTARAGIGPSSVLSSTPMGSNVWARREGDRSQPNSAASPPSTMTQPRTNTPTEGTAASGSSALAQGRGDGIEPGSEGYRTPVKTEPGARTEAAPVLNSANTAPVGANAGGQTARAGIEPSSAPKSTPTGSNVLARRESDRSQPNSVAPPPYTAQANPSGSSVLTQETRDRIEPGSKGYHAPVKPEPGVQTKASTSNTIDTRASGQGESGRVQQNHEESQQLGDVEPLSGSPVTSVRDSSAPRQRDRGSTERGSESCRSVADAMGRPSGTSPSGQTERRTTEQDPRGSRQTIAPEPLNDNNAASISETPRTAAVAADGHNNAEDTDEGTDEGTDSDDPDNDSDNNNNDNVTSIKYPTLTGAGGGGDTDTDIVDDDADDNGDNFDGTSYETAPAVAVDPEPIPNDQPPVEEPQTGVQVAQHASPLSYALPLVLMLVMMFWSFLDVRRMPALT